MVSPIDVEVAAQLGVEVRFQVIADIDDRWPPEGGRQTRRCQRQVSPWRIKSLIASSRVTTNRAMTYAMRLSSLGVSS